MRVQNLELQEVSDIINKDFLKSGIKDILGPNDAESIDELKNYLREKLAYLLDNNFDHLVNTLYRIDLNEDKLHELFSETNRQNLPDALADMIVQRQIQKVHFRKLYKEGKI